MRLKVANLRLQSHLPEGNESMYEETDNNILKRSMFIAGHVYPHPWVVFFSCTSETTLIDMVKYIM